MMYTIDPWLTPIGLTLELVGVLIITLGLFVTRDQALKLGLHTYVPLTEAVHGSSSRVQYLLSQARRAKWGLGLIVLGFALQLFGTLTIWCPL